MINNNLNYLNKMIKKKYLKKNVSKSKKKP